MSDKKIFTLPNPMASDSEKASKEYGLSIAQEISKFWFNGGLITHECEFFKRRLWVQQKRAVAKGKQSVKQYQDKLAGENVELTYLNLDWRPINLAGKFIRIVVNGLKEDRYRVQVNAIDKASVDERLNKIERMRYNMINKPLFQDAKERFNLDLMPKEFIPSDEEELSLHAQIKGRVKAEIAQELLIKAVKKLNRWEYIKERVDYDLAECGLGVMECYTDKTEGVKIRYVDIENYIHSVTSHPDFNDVYYHGEVVQKTIGDLQREGDFTDDELREIASYYHKKNPDLNRGFGMNYSAVQMESLLDYQIDVLRFSYKTSKEQVYKKKMNPKGNFKMTRKDSDYNPPERSDYKKVSRVLDTWYEGYYIVGTQYLYDYKEAENIQTDVLNRAKSSFVCRSSGIYKNQLFSFVDDIEPIIDQMQRIHLKIQHLIAEVRPDGVEIDWDMMVNISNGKSGEQLDTKEILSLLSAKGIVFKRTYFDQEGNLRQGRAAEPINGGVPNNLIHLINSWTHYYNLIRDILGINPFRDGTQPHDSLVGVQERAIEQSNLSTENIERASLDLSLQVSELIGSRLRDIFKWSDLKRIYLQILGPDHMDVLDTIKNIHIHEFGYVVELLPSAEEIMKFEESLNLAMQTGEITSADKLEVRELMKSNPKLAAEFLKLRIKKNRQAAEDAAMRQMAAKSQSDTQSAQMASQFRIQEQQAIAQLELQKEQQLSSLRIQERAQIIAMEAPMKEKEIASEIYRDQMKAQQAAYLTQYKEEMKDERQDRKDANTSRILQQKQREEPAIDFTKPDGFDDIMRKIGAQSQELFTENPQNMSGI